MRKANSTGLPTFWNVQLMRPAKTAISVKTSLEAMLICGAFMVKGSLPKQVQRMP